MKAGEERRLSVRRPAPPFEASLCPTSLEIALKAVGLRPLRSRLLAASRGPTSLEVKLKLLLGKPEGKFVQYT